MGEAINQCIKYQDAYRVYDLSIFDSVICISSLKDQFTYNKHISFIVNIICGYEAIQKISELLPYSLKGYCKVVFWQDRKTYKRVK